MNRPSLSSLRALVLGGAVSLSSLISCVATGSVAEQQALTADLHTLKSAQVIVNAKDADWAQDAAELKKVLAESFQQKGWWSVGASGDLVFDVTFTSFDKGSKGMRMLSMGGEAEVVSDVVIRDRAGKTLAKLTVTGNSKRQSETSVGGYNTSWGDSLPGRAVRALADQIVEYIETKNPKS